MFRKRFLVIKKHIPSEIFQASAESRLEGVKHPCHRAVGCGLRPLKVEASLSQVFPGDSVLRSIGPHCLKGVSVV